MARPGAHRRGYRPVRLRWVVHAHAVASGRASRSGQCRPRSRQPRRRPARHVDRSRHAGRVARRPRAHRDLRPSIQCRLSTGLARRWRVRCRRVAPARGRPDDRSRRDRGHPPSPARLHRPARRRRPDTAMVGLQRQHRHLRHERALADRAACRTRGAAPDAGGGRGRDDDSAGISRRRLGGRAADRATDGIRVGRPRPLMGCGEPRLRVARRGFLG